MLKIDIHNHILPKKIPDFKSKFGYGGFIQLHPTKDGHADMIRDDGKFFRAVEPNCMDPKVRLEEMDKFNVDVQVLSTVPVMFSEWAKPEQYKVFFHKLIFGIQIAYTTKKITHRDLSLF